MLRDSDSKLNVWWRRWTVVDRFTYHGSWLNKADSRILTMYLCIPKYSCWLDMSTIPTVLNFYLLLVRVLVVSGPNLAYFWIEYL